MAPLWDRSMNLAAILMGAAAVTSASAQSFHVDFGSFALGFGVPSSGYGAAANAAGHWNLVDSDQLGSGVFTTPPLRTTANASSGVVLELDPLGGRFFPFEENAPLTTGDDQRLLDDCCYTLGDSELRFRGLAAGVYQVLTYALAPDDATFRTGVAVSGSPDPLQSVGGDFSQGFVRGVTHAEHEVELGPGSTLVVRISVLSGIDSINGIQVLQLGRLVGTTTCAGVPNSTGAAATLTTIGSDELFLNQLELRARGLPAQATTLFLTSASQGSLPNAGGGQGTLCLGQNIGRFNGPGQVQSSGAGGIATLQLDLTAHPTATGIVSIQVGETWHFQAWYRDSSGGAATSNLSSARSVTFL